MVHVCTGNRLDVLYDFSRGVKVFVGLQSRESNEVISLPDPWALVEVLTNILDECGVPNRGKKKERIANETQKNT